MASLRPPGPANGLPYSILHQRLIPQRSRSCVPSAFRFSKSPRSHASSTNSSPLVRARTKASPGSSPFIDHPPPRSSSGKKIGVYAPYTRITLGVIICGAMIYSMSSTTISFPHLLEPASIATRDDLRKRESGITPSSPMRLRMESFIKTQQDEIVSALESLDPTTKFRTDRWSRPNGGGGISCVLQDSAVFEKAGVNTSVVYGTLPRPAIEKMRVNHPALDPDVESLEFFAAGISCVIHPQNPNAPTVHFNYRYFETMDTDGNCTAWWFGGGTDLTPAYLFDEDAIQFHRTIKAACDDHDKEYYPRFKKWCDKYFYIPHRGETRGVGGVFFDDLDAQEKDQEQLFSFIQSCLRSFLSSYMPIIEKRKDMAFGEKEKDWQGVRRGRYVEFNLVHDRGTAFGLQTPGARVESILMSLPGTAKWRYMHEPQMGGREERLMKVLREPREWV